MAVVGLDVGTTGVKSSVISEDGKLLGFSYREYMIQNDAPGWYEIDMHLLMECATTVLRESVQKSKRRDIQSICVTSFGESFVLLDENNDILDRTMVYMDKRGEVETEQFTEKFSRKTISEVTGLLPHGMYSAGKIKWLVDNRPEIIGKTKKICFVADCVLQLLGAGHFTDYSLASRSMLFDVKNKTWWKPAVHAIGISTEMMPALVKTGSEVGLLRKDFLNELGFDKAIKLIIGGHDQITNAIGAGLLEIGHAMNGIGTVDCVTACFRKGTENFRMPENNLPIVPYILDDASITYAFNFSGGSMLKWFRDNFTKDLVSGEAYKLLEQEMPENPSKILVLPHFAGSGTPFMDADSKACICGLDFNVDRGTLYRAFLEGETFEMRYNLDCLERCNIHIGSIRTVGGGSSSKRWMQIRADILNKEIICLDIEQAGTLGSAMLSLVHNKTFASLFEARERLVRVKARYYPNQKSKAFYDEQYERYKRIYPRSNEILK